MHRHRVVWTRLPAAAQGGPGTVFSQPHGRVAEAGPACSAESWCAPPSAAWREVPARPPLPEGCSLVSRRPEAGRRAFQCHRRARPPQRAGASRARAGRSPLTSAGCAPAEDGGAEAAGEAEPPEAARGGRKPLPGPELTVPPEVFMVGPKAFSWTPLPPALGSSCSSYQPGAGGPLGPPTASQKDQFTSDPHETPRIQECLSVQSSPALQSCPMCQKEFAPTLVQLDVDSHLAQCLAESTEDMEW